MDRKRPPDRPPDRTTGRPPDQWRAAGFDEDFTAHCTCTGWTLADVSSVLCTDLASDSPIDWCYSGLDPLEAHAAIRDNVAAPGSRPPQPRASASGDTNDRKEERSPQATTRSGLAP